MAGPASSGTSSGTSSSGASSPPSSATLAALGQRPSAAYQGGRGRGVVLGEGVVLRGGRLLVDGAPVAARASLRRSGGTTLLVAAQRIAGIENGGTGPIAKLSATARRGLVAELLPLLTAAAGRRGDARASLQDVRARSAAFTILEECALSMRAPSESRGAQALAHALVEAATREPNPGLRAHMERRIGQLPTRLAKPDLAPVVEALRSKHAHERPLNREWLTGTPPTLKVLASVQDEFWKGELAAYRKAGYSVEVDGDKTTARKTINNVLIEVQLRERDDDVLDGLAMRDVDVVLFTGHANLGGVAKIALEHAPARAKGDKLIALFACRSKQNVDAVERRFPGQHLLVSAEGTYAHDDRIVMHALLDGIANDKSYAQIEMAAKREGLWESKNYFLPNESVALVDQGRVFIPESTTAIGTSISMRARATAPSSADGLARGAVSDAVAWVNTIQGYWAEELGTRADKQLHDALLPGGWFDGPPEQIVKLEDVVIDGKMRVRISVNAAYASQDKDALAMMVSFAAGKELVARGDPGRTEHERRMLGLAMAVSYVYYLVEYSDVADVLLRQFAKTFRFPPGLSWPVVEKAITLGGDLDCSPKTIAALERGMEHVFLEVNPDRTSSAFRRRIGAALEVLQASGTKIGALTHEAIVTGKVLVDEIDDLSQADYARIRRDFLKDGVALPIDGHKKLHDHHSQAWRAITTDMNGYMWDDRIYVAPGLSATQLASTLVHEVNHVLNKSEEHYRGDRAVLVEEYRAFYAEALWVAQQKGRRTLGAAECKEIKEGVIHDYGLKDVTAADVSDVPPGLIDV